MISFSLFSLILNDLTETLKIITKSTSKEKNNLEIMNYIKQENVKEYKIGKLEDKDIIMKGHNYISRNLNNLTTIEDYKSREPRIGHLTNERILEIISKGKPYKNKEYVLNFKENKKYCSMVIKVEPNKIIVKTIILRFSTNASYGHLDQEKLTVENFYPSISLQ